MSERREYFRVRALARVRLQALDKARAEALRHALYARAPRPLSTERAHEAGTTTEGRAVLEALRQLSLALERIERRLERIERAESSPGDAPGTVEISLSGAGFAGPFELELAPDQLAWVELELPGSGLAPISALVRPVPCAPGEPPGAFQFEHIHPEDREQLVQLALRLQSTELRAARSAESP
jgi:hypothetical protein